MCRQDLIQILDRQPSNAGIGRADTIDGRVQRLARDNRREQREDVLQMTGALGVGCLSLRRLVGVRKIQQAIAAPDLRCHGELPFHDRDHVAAIDRQLGVLRQNPVDRATAVVAHLESRIIESAHQAIEAPGGGDSAKNSW